MTLQWVPGHAGLPGNGLADEVARAAADLDQDRAPVDLQSARSMLRRHAQWKWTERMQATRYFERSARSELPRESGSASHAGTAWRHRPLDAAGRIQTPDRPAEPALSSNTW